MAREQRRAWASSKPARERLPNAELDVLNCVWQTGKVTARQIRESLARSRPMAHGSVVTLLTRLESKGLIAKEKYKIGKAFVYKATKKPELVQKKLTKEFLARVFNGNPAALLSAVIGAQPISSKQMGQMRAVLSR